MSTPAPLPKHTTAFFVQAAITFTLAKVVRDAQESTALASRIDQARVDRILSEHDPFRGGVSLALSR
jgi:hypothetical protein